MDTRSILPIAIQYAAVVLPFVVSAIIAVAGLAIAGAAKAYNTHIRDVYVRGVVATCVKQAEMLLGGNSVAKRQQVLDRLSVLLPWLSHADASRLIEAAVLDLNQFQALTTAAALTGANTVTGATVPLEPTTMGYSAALLPQRVIVEHVVNSTTPPITASSTAPQAVGPVDTLPSTPLPQG